MFPYIPTTEQEKSEMLKKINAENISELFKDIPKDLIIEKYNLEESKSELEIQDILKKISAKNKSVNDYICFLGSGAYDHYIPSVCGHVASKSEFYTAYTPYQPEISQGTLQAIFEYQSMLCALTEMDVSNISMYDVSTAMAEACSMAVDATKRNKIIISASVNPQSRNVVKTYGHFKNFEIVEIEENDGISDIEKIKSELDSSVAAVVIQTPNFFGIIEDLSGLEKVIHDNKSLLILSVDPISLGILKTPKEWGADIVVGDCQCFGNKLNFGGPHLGFLNTTKKLVRKMPGRVVGETKDVDGKTGYCLTLQTREQHIRREKATSNICSDQTLMAINSAVYLSTLGKQGIKEVAVQIYSKANYALKKLSESGKYKPLFNQPVFKEFALISDFSPEFISNKLFENGIFGAYDISKEYPKYKNAVQFAVTEKRTKSEIDYLSEILEVIS